MMYWIVECPRWARIIPNAGGRFAEIRAFLRFSAPSGCLGPGGVFAFYKLKKEIISFYFWRKLSKRIILF